MPKNLADLFILNDLKVNFDDLCGNFGLSMTLKVHIVIHHYKDYLDLTEKKLETHKW